jgi:hypothetical protein
MRGIDVGLARRSREVVVLTVTVAVVLALLVVPSARATTVFQDLTSAGPLTNLWVGSDLDCQVQYAGEPAYEFFPSTAAPGDCGTFVSVTGSAGAATLYGPDFSTNQVTATPFSGSKSYVPYTAVPPQSTAAGSVTTNVTAGSTGLSVAETDSYAAGDTAYRTDITLRNTGRTTLSGRLYHAADCYLQGTDTGYGEFNSSTSAPACTQAPNNSPPGLVEEFVPLTGSSHYVEGYFATVWKDVAAQGDLPDTCDCTIQEDNGAGIDWDYSVRAGGSQTFSTLTNLSSTGVLAGAPVNLTAPSVGGSPTVGSTLTESNGTWSNNPTGYTYRWEDCDATGANCAVIAGATGQSYGLAVTDVEHTIRVVETASNGDGPGAPATSPPTALVTSPPTAPVTLPPQPVTLTTNQTAGTTSGSSISIPAGTVGETDLATLTGASAAQATGSIQYGLYSNASCVASRSVFRSATQTVFGAVAPASSPVTDVLAAGTYYWQVTYSGDTTNLPATSRCGSEVLTVTPAANAAATGTATTTAVKLKVGCAIVPCTLKLTVTGTEQVEIPAAVTRKTKKRKFRTETVTICSDAVHIIRSGDVAVDAKLTRKGKQYLHKRHGHVKLKLTLTETIKSTKLVTERTVNVVIAKASTPKQPTGSGERPK